MKKIISFILITFYFVSLNYAQHVGVGTTTPDASAQLDIEDTNKGILIPRISIPDLNLAAPVSAPATSLMVYNTSTITGTGFHYWDGNKWVKLLDGEVSDSDWLEVGTNTPPDDINDNIFTQSNVGIGTDTPLNKFHVSADTDGVNDSLFIVNSNGHVGLGTTNYRGMFSISGQTSFDGNGNFIARNRPHIVFEDAFGGDRSYITGYDGGLLLGGNATSFNNAANSVTEPRTDLYVSNIGQVGIGSLTPSQRLEVVGNIGVSNDSKILFSKPSGDITLTLNNGLGNASNGADILIADRGMIAAEHDLHLNIDADGNTTNDAHFSILADAESSAATELLKVIENGNVGIGISNPEENLVVNGITRMRGLNSLDDPDQRIVLEIGINPIANNAAAIGPDRHFRLLTETNLLSPATDFLVFEGLDGNNTSQDGGFLFRGRGGTAANREILTLRGSGNVGVGTNNPTNRLHVFNDGEGNLLRMEDNDKSWFTGISSSNTWGIWEDDGSGTNNRFHISELGDIGISTTSPSALLSVNGTANKPGGGSWAVFSDRRAKENIKTYNRGLQELLKINPVSFNYKKQFGWGTDKHVGLIAQEVEQIVPSMVKEKEIQNLKDFREVDPNELTYILINAVKEQQVLIEDLQKENDYLKSSMVDQETTQASTNQELRDMIQQLKLEVGVLQKDRNSIPQGK